MKNLITLTALIASAAMALAGNVKIEAIVTDFGTQLPPGVQIGDTINVNAAYNPHGINVTVKINDQRWQDRSPGSYEEQTDCNLGTVSYRLSGDNVFMLLEALTPDCQIPDLQNFNIDELLLQLDGFVVFGQLTRFPK